MNTSKRVAIIFSVVGLAAGTAGTIAMQTHAAEKNSTNQAFMRGIAPAAAGSVTAINGNSITINDKRTGNTYIVDAGSAKIEKFTPSTGAGSSAKPARATITVSGISVGDNISVQGTVSGSNITATKIMDGMMGIMGRGFGKQMGYGAAGTVSAVNGSTITLTGKDGKTYTIEAGSATVKKISDSSIADIKVGDTLMVNGSTSGTTVTAKQIVDGVINLGGYK